MIPTFCDSNRFIHLNVDRVHSGIHRLLCVLFLGSIVMILPLQVQASDLDQLQSIQSTNWAVSPLDTTRIQGPITLQQLRDELKKRGISENELRSRLIQKGVVLENIPPSQITRYRSTILETIAELEVENNTKTEVVVEGNVTAPSTQTGDYFALEEISEEAPDIYGHDLFRKGNLEQFLLNDSSQAPDSYVLGTGDRLRVTIFGISQGDFVLEVNEEGYVLPDNMPRIFLRGMSYSDARRLLRQRYRVSYTFDSNQFIVSLQQPRSIAISVLGEAMRKGSFTLSPFNTILNALYVAGGPDSLGTVRNIEVIRGSEKLVVDLYEYLNDPSGQLPIDLNHRDIIFFPKRGNVIRIQGAINRPMRYELKSGETLADLIEFAGGLQAGAYPDFAQLERFERGERVLIDVDLSSLSKDSNSITAAQLPLKNGDVVHVRPSRKVIDSKISVYGAVSYPGKLGYSTDLTLEETIRRSGGLRPTASSKAFLQRRDLADTTRVSFMELNLSDRTSMETLMQPYDELRFLNRSDFTNETFVGITGAVKTAVRLPYTNEITLQQLFEVAGGIQLGASLARVQVFRRELFTDKEQVLDELIITLDSTYTSVEPGNFELRPFDQVVVRLTPGYTLDTTVEINGEVNYPGIYILENNQTHLSDLIAKAGGLRTTADPIGSTLFREYGGKGFIVTNLRDAQTNPRNEQYDPILLPGDVVNINRRENTVTLAGNGIRLRLAVDDSLTSDKLSVTYRGSRDAKWYIENFGGGFKQDADRASVTVRLKNGQVLATRKRLFGRKYPLVEPGSTIEVDLKPAEVLKEEEKSKFDWDEFTTKTIQTTTSVVTILLLVRQL
jgi:protein involved in polysaccharide export with SLBB domain